MSGPHDNPCNTCSANQDCCTRLSGLMLAPDEYETLFRNSAEVLAVKKTNRFIVVSSRHGGACPHWGDGGCVIYPERPIDCRLYPYVIRHLIEKKRKVHLVFHDRSACPQRKSMCALMPEPEIRALVKAFGRKIYGEEIAIFVQREKGVFSRLRYRVEAALSRLRYKTG